MEGPIGRGRPCSSRSVVSDSDRKRERDPVGTLARQIAAVDQITIDVFAGAVANSALKARVRLARTHQGEDLGNDAPLLHEIPRYPRSGRGEQPLRVPAILRADVDIQPQLLAEVECHRDITDKTALDGRQ